MRPANDNIPVFPVEGSLEWRWIMQQIAQYEDDWLEHQKDLDLTHERQLFFDGEEQPWYAADQFEIQEPEVFTLDI